MASPTKPKRPTSWLTRQEMAAVFDCSVGYFARELAPTFRSAGHVKTVAGRPYFYARGCIETWAKARYGPESEAPLSDSDLWLLGQLN